MPRREGQQRIEQGERGLGLMPGQPGGGEREQRVRMIRREAQAAQRRRDGSLVAALRQVSGGKPGLRRGVIGAEPHRLGISLGRAFRIATIEADRPGDDPRLGTCRIGFTGQRGGGLRGLEIAQGPMRVGKIDASRALPGVEFQDGGKMRRGRCERSLPVGRDPGGEPRFRGIRRAWRVCGHRPRL
jgi:hypothetical protein